MAVANSRMVALSTSFRVIVLLIVVPLCSSWIGTSWRTSVLPAFGNSRLFASKQQKQQPNRPAFQQPNHIDKNGYLDEAASRQENEKSGTFRRRKYGSDSHLSSLHEERIRTAGRVGTKRFVDPCRVFVGNLPFDVDDAGLSDWVCGQMGLPPALLLKECKIVRDWKTGQSKGYGFVHFTDAIHATVCIDKCNGKDLGGRSLTVSQGKRKGDATLVFLEKKKKGATQPVDGDEEAIRAGILESAEDDDGVEAEEEFYKLDPEEAAILRRLDPDLIPESELSDEGFVDEVDDGDSDSMNRAQRRQAARDKKRRKLPTKGFGGNNSGA